MYKSRQFVIVSGIFSTMVFLYVFTVHATLVTFAVRFPNIYQRIEIQSKLMSHPAMVISFFAICIGGPTLMLTFLNHAFKNSKLTMNAKALWTVALVCGYGLPFYWWWHIQNFSHPDPHRDGLRDSNFRQ